MNIRVKPETEAWLKSAVDAGQFPSVEEAIDRLVIEHQAAWLDVAEDDHLWAKPEIDEALASIENGDGRSLEAVEQRLRERVKSKP